VSAESGSSSTTSSSGPQSGQDATEQSQEMAALVTQATELQTLPAELWLGGPTFAAFLRQADAASLIDLLNYSGLAVALDFAPPSGSQDIAARIVALRPDLPVLAANLASQASGTGHDFATSTLPPADQSGETGTILPDDAGGYILVILVVTH
jgi:hypothetical protein